MKDYLSIFRSVQEDPEKMSLLRKSLTSATNVGEALIPEHLEQVISNTVVRLVPELALPTLRYGAQKFHEFNQLTSIPKAGSAMGEGSTTPTRNSTSTRKSIQLKVFKRKGAVTGFMEAASEDYIDSITFETEAHVQSFGNDMRTYLIWGNKDADAYAFDGLDKFIATNRIQIAAGGTKVQTNLKLLDDLIDAGNRKQGNTHRRVFLMSPELNSQLTRLYQNVRDNRPAQRSGTKVEEIDGGFRFESYRGIPIIETSATRPLSQMGTVATASAGAGGAITNDEYFFAVSAVTWDGEQGASAIVSETTTGADTITLSWTAVEGALFYKIYSGLTTGQGTMPLVRVISAFQYDGNGTITGDTTSYVFTADPAPDDSVPSHMQGDLFLDWNSGKPEEVLFFWDLDEFQGLGKMAYTNSGGSRFRNLIGVEPLAKTDDNEPFLLKSYAALIPSFEATSGLIRGIKVEA
jgi:hypothetical protein